MSNLCTLVSLCEEYDVSLASQFYLSDQGLNNLTLKLLESPAGEQVLRELFQEIYGDARYAGAISRHRGWQKS